LLKSENIFLRTLQASDADVMLKWENDPQIWVVSGTKKPFTKEEIDEFVKGNHDLKENQQIRYFICLNESIKPIGTIDLFEYNAHKKMAGVGVLIAEDANKQKGFATEALSLMIHYCRNELGVVNLFCNITKDNTASIRLFEKNGFQFVKEQVLFGMEVNYYELKL